MGPVDTSMTGTAALENPDSDGSAAGEYRRWDGVRLADDVLLSTRPLAATRLNAAAVDTVDALESDGFRTPAAVARETNQEPESVERLFERLHDRRFLEWRPSRDPADRPPVSVVVTVRNGRDHLQACLDALAALDYPAYEVVVVDDGSTDGTSDVAGTHSLADADALRSLSVGSAADPLGIGASRNRGVDAAAHDVIAFTDADCRPRQDWLSELVPVLASHDLVGGRVRPARESAASAYERSNSSLDMGRHAARVDPGGETPYLPTANLVGRRALFEAVGFPERNVAEDVALCWDALDDGFSVVYAPSGVVEHVYRSGVRAFASRRSAYGASEALLARNRGREETASVDVPVTAVLAVVLAGLGLLLGGVASSLASAGFVGVAGVALGTGGLGLWRRYRRFPSVVSADDLARSWGRERLSTAYAFARELTRYYAAPLALIGGIGVVAGAGVLGATLLLLVVAAVALPLVVEHRVHDPSVSALAYAGYYLADHLGYQYGLYRGAVIHRTLAHLNPLTRFRLVGHGRAS